MFPFGNKGPRAAARVAGVIYDVAMTDEFTWDTFARLVTTDESALAAVRQFTADPDAYFADHEDDLIQRGIEDSEDVTGAVVVIDALGKVDEVAYMGWKSPVDEVVGLLERIPRVKDTGINLEVLVEPGYPQEADVETVVGWINALLADSDVTVAILDEDSDAYPLIAVPTDRAASIAETADSLGAEVRILRADASEVPHA